MKEEGMIVCGMSWLGPKLITNYSGIWIDEINSMKEAINNSFHKPFLPQRNSFISMLSMKFFSFWINGRRTRRSNSAKLKEPARGAVSFSSINLIIQLKKFSWLMGDWKRLLPLFSSTQINKFIWLRWLHCPNFSSTLLPPLSNLLEKYGQ